MDKLNAILSGFEYDGKEPYLVLDFHNNKPVQRSKFYLKDKAFTLEKLPDTFCIGAYNLQNMQFNPCPNNNRVETGKTMCPLCKKMTGFNPAFYNTEIHSPQQQFYNARPHVVYLAHFGKGSIKVGIAHRVPRRWLEQGARTATIIKHCKDAYEARELEFKIISNLKLLEALSSNTKRKLLIKPYDIDSAIEELNKTRDLIESKLSEKLEINPIVVLDEYYLSPGTNPFVNLADISKSNTYISGLFVALIGDILIMCHNSSHYMTSLKSYLSHTVIIEQDLKDNILTTTGQQSLF